MKLLKSLAATALLLAACGKAPQSSTAQSVGGEKLGTIAGHVTITEWHCGGAALPPDHGPQGPCETDGPFVTTFAVAKVLDASTESYELVTYVTSDADGAYSVDVQPGEYKLVSKYEITHDSADATGLSHFATELFTVRGGETVTEDLHFMTPPPPISIGVGN